MFAYDFGRRRLRPCFDCTDDGYCTMNCGPAAQHEDFKMAQPATVFPADKLGRHPDGIYFGMPEDEYHADDALGSSGIKLLRQSVYAYWHQSAMNPRPPRKKEAEPLKVGSAYHAIVLEGAEAFHGRYIRRPDDDDSASSADKAALTKAANAKAKAAGKEALHGDDYDRAMDAADMIHTNPDLDGAFTKGVPEVTIIRTLGNGVRLKYRLDYLKLRGFGDLKSIANEKRRPISLACMLAIKDYRYDISIAHYLLGRAAMPALHKAGLVFGDHDAEWLKKVMATKEFGAQIVFIQKSGAPEVWSRTFSPANPIMATAFDHVEEGIKAYVDAMAKFGPDKPWLVSEPVSELDPSEMPASFFYDAKGGPGK